MGLNTYCKSEDFAKQIVLDAGNGKEPRFHSKHELNHYGNTKKGVYFDHYHTYLSPVTYDALGFENSTGQVFFGEITINL